MVLDVDPQKRRISLGLKQMHGQSVGSLPREASGRAPSSKARSRTSPSSACSSACPAISTAWSISPTSTGRSRARRRSRTIKKGDMVKVQVLDVDVEKERISLGIKQLAGRSARSRRRPDQEGRRRDLHRHRRSPTAASRSTLADGLPGFIRKSELSRDRAEQRPDRFAVGEKVDAKITAIDKRHPQGDAVDQGARGRRGEEGDGRIRLVRFRRQPRRHSRRGAPPAASKDEKADK